MINLFWYKMPNGEKNFGDELGPYIVKELSDQEIRYVPIVNKWYKIFPLYILGIIKGNNSPFIFFDVLRSFFAKDVLISIGSIITSYNKENVKVWGSGMLNSNDKINKADFLAVRGEYTQNRIKELGFKPPQILGDPALLLPLIIKPSEKKYKVGIIPHYIHYKEVQENTKSKDILIINLLDEIEKVVHDITSCETTLSSSLHGLIISHSYNIPSVWVNFSEHQLGGDNIKFKDYFSSVKINSYDAVSMKLDSIDVETFNGIFETDSNEIQVLPNVKVEKIQKDLLNAFPYKLSSKYEIYI